MWWPLPRLQSTLPRKHDVPTSSKSSASQDGIRTPNPLPSLKNLKLESEGTLHELDPHGETVFYVRQPEHPFAEWNESKQTRDQEAEPRNSPDETILNEEEALKVEMRIRASPRHLILASPYFAAMLRPHWK